MYPMPTPAKSWINFERAASSKLIFKVLDGESTRSTISPHALTQYPGRPRTIGAPRQQRKLLIPEVDDRLHSAI